MNDVSETTYGGWHKADTTLHYTPAMRMISVRVYGDDIGMHRIRAAAIARGFARRNQLGRVALLTSGGQHYPFLSNYSDFKYVLV